LSMSDVRRAQSSWRRIRRDIAPPDLDGRRPIVKIRSSRTKSNSQKPYLPSPGAGSQRWRFRRPTCLVDGARKRSCWRS
jgi:hypothetical protein